MWGIGIASEVMHRIAESMIGPLMVPVSPTVLRLAVIVVIYAPIKRRRLPMGPRRKGQDGSAVPA